MKAKISRPRIPVISCPHCNGRAIVRSSEAISPVYRVLRFRCDDDSCGHKFEADMTVVRTIMPSLRPNPNIHLPLSAAAISAVARPANDDMPAAANDVDPAQLSQPTVSS